MTKQLSPLRRKDQATGYAQAVKDIVAWLREKPSHTMAASAIERIFGTPNVAD